MNILVRHIASSTLAGLEKLHSGSIVRIGHDDECGICFHPQDDPQVSAEHAEIHDGSDGIRIVDLGTSEGTYINDERISGSCLLGPDDTIRLGPSGPQFQIVAVGGESASSIGGGAAPATQSGLAGGGSRAVHDGSRPTSDILPTVQGTRQPCHDFSDGHLPPIRLAGRPASGPSGSPIQSGVQAAPSSALAQRVVPPASMAPRPQRRHKRGRSRTPSPLTLLRSRPDAKQVGVNTLIGVVQAATSRERRRMVSILALSVLVILAAGGGGFWHLRRTRGASGPDWEAVFAKVSPSICLVLKRENGDPATDHAFGTAWSVSRGFFATNAHVAKPFLEAKAEGRKVEFFIRTPGETPEDLRIADATVHPGFDQFAELLNDYAPYDHQWGGITPISGACDVALFRVAKEDESKQPPLLSLAGPHGDIKVGTSIGSAGFPMEGIPVNIHRPSSERRTGSVVKMTDDWIGDATGQNVTWLHYHFQVSGGASGSPVVDDQGRVVALVSAGDVAARGHRGVRIMASDTCRGPAGFLLAELLDGRAEVAQKARREQWEAGFLKAFQDGVSNPDLLAQRVLMPELTAQLATPERTREILRRFFPNFDVERHTLAIENVSSDTATLMIQQGRGKATFDNVNLRQSSMYFFFVTCTNRPVDIAVSAKQKFTEATSYCHYCTVFGSGRYTVRVESGPDESDGRVDLTLQLYRAVMVEKKGNLS